MHLCSITRTLTWRMVSSTCVDVSFSWVTSTSAFSSSVPLKRAKHEDALPEGRTALGGAQHNVKGSRRGGHAAEGVLHRLVDAETVESHARERERERVSCGRAKGGREGGREESGARLRLEKTLFPHS